MSIKEQRIRCNKCGKEFEVGNRPNGLPNGVGFQLEDGWIYAVCADCLIEMGWEKWKEELEQEKKNEQKGKDNQSNF